MVFLTLLFAAAVSDLGSPSFDRRQYAQSALTAAGPLAWPAAIRGLSHPDPEIRWRCEQLLRPMHRLIGRAVIIWTIWGRRDQKWVEPEVATWLHDNGHQWDAERIVRAAKLVPDNAIGPWGYIDDPRDAMAAWINYARSQMPGRVAIPWPPTVGVVHLPGR